MRVLSILLSVREHGLLTEGIFNIGRGFIPVVMTALCLRKFCQQRQNVFCVKYRGFFLVDR